MDKAEARRQYKKEYYYKNKEKCNASSKKYRDKNKDKIKEYAKQYYLNNKEQVDEKHKIYQKNNRKKITEMINKRRKKVAEELKTKGQIWTYLPRTQRENKMVHSLAINLNISEELARKMLIDNEWDYKMLLEKGINLNESI